MTITVTTVQAGPFAATGAAQALPFSFKAFTEAELEVFALVDGVEEPFDLADYSVTLNENPDGTRAEGGSVTITATTGLALYVRAKPDMEQDQVWSNQGSRLSNLNEALDRGALRDLSLDRRMTDAEAEIFGVSGFIATAVQTTTDNAATASAAAVAAVDARNAALQAVIDAEAKVAEATNQVALATAQVVLATAQAALASAERVAATAQAVAAAGSAGSAAVAQAQAELAALAAGAPLYTSMPAPPFTGVPSPFLYSATGGVSVYTHDGSSETLVGWLGKVSFETVSSMLATTVGLGPTGNTIEANGHRYEVVAAGEHLTTAGGVKLKVLPGSDGAYHTAALGAPTGIDDAGVLTLLAAAASGKLVIDYHVTPYACNTLVPNEFTHVVAAPGVVIEGRLLQTRCVQIQKPNVIFEGYGATIKRHVGQTSHAIYINASTTNHGKNVIFRGFEVHGNGAAGTGGTGENDVVYIGGSPQGYGGDPALEAVPENILVEDCILRYPRRNVLSVVAGNGVVVRNNTLDGLGAVVLQVGVDVEANRYMADGSAPTRRIRVHGNKVINCAGFSLGVIFGDDVWFEDNDVIVSVSGATGIGGGAGGAQFEDDRYRPGDRLGVSAFDLATGEITVSDGSPTLHELGIHTGMWVQGQIRSGSGAAWPAEIVTPYRYCISAINAAGTKFKISQHQGVGEITSFAGAGVGVLNDDPVVSDLSFNVFRLGQCSRVGVRNNRVTYTGPAAAVPAISVVTFYGWDVEDNIVEMGLSTGAHISATYGYGINIKSRKGLVSTGGTKGVQASAVSNLVLEGLAVKNTTVDAFAIGGRFIMNDCIAIECAGDLVDVTATNGGVIEKFRAVMNGKTCTRGIRFNAGTRPAVIDCDLTGAGSSATTALSVDASVTDVTVTRTKDFAGNYYGIGSKTHDFASIAAGAVSAATTVALTGGKVGVQCIGILGTYTAGIEPVAICSSTTAVQFYARNLTAGAIDPASMTITTQLPWAT